MKYCNWMVGLAAWSLLMAVGPASAVAQDAGATSSDRTAVQLSAGVKGGIAGVAGYGFENHESVTDQHGERLPPGDTEWGYPEYYGHFGLGPNVGIVGEFRANGFLGVEIGYHLSEDNASGYVDKNMEGTNQTIARIHSEQRTTAHHIPIMLKLAIPDDIVRPYIGAGLQMVIQQSSDLTYEQEQRAGRFGTEGAMEDLNHRNQIETSTYPVLIAAGGVEVAFGSLKIPVELRVGYSLGFDEAMEERARGEDGQIIYDGAYTGHFAVFGGLLYEFDLVQ